MRAGSITGDGGSSVDVLEIYGRMGLHNGALCAVYMDLIEGTL
jgi:hypothetical protein